MRLRPVNFSHRRQLAEQEQVVLNRIEGDSPVLRSASFHPDHRPRRS